MNEIWKDIVGFEGLYMISNFGRVKSLARFINSRFGKRLLNEKILKNKPDKNGYHKVGMYKNNKHYNAIVHRLVATAFIPNPLGLPEVNHLKSKDNNNVDSLEWCSSKDNTAHAIIIGLRDNHGTKLTKQQVLEIRSKYIPRIYDTYMLAEEYNVSQSLIHNVIRNKSYKL
jgi:hypothetical protein